MRRENNFDILRLVLAWIVVVTHCYDLSGSPVLGHFSALYQSRRAVEGFFGISGCLIVASWDNSRSFRDYLNRRARRILPAYWLALAFCLVLGSIVTSLSFAEFWKSPETYKYLAANLTFLNFLHPALPGVFANNPDNAAMDGALWTIKIEIAFYLFVPLLVWAVRRIGRAWVLGGTFVLSLAFRLLTQHLGHESLSMQLPGQLDFFMVGSAVYYYFPKFVEYRRLMWTCALVLIALSFWTDWLAVDAIATPLLVLCFAFLAPRFEGVTKYGDFSYGTYVLHWPIVQTVVAAGLFARSPWQALGLVIATVAIMSVTSWYTVEKRFLRSARTSRPQVPATVPAQESATAP